MAISRILSWTIIYLSDYYPETPGFLRDGQAAQFPVMSCTSWGFSCPAAYAPGGELLPRRFTLTRLAPGGLFSVTLSVTVHFHGRCPRVLRGMLPCGVRTFLPPNFLGQRSSTIR